jgi:glycosyltransferase involved in cell wall biosynthesis
MTDPRVSICIPAYNRPATLEVAIRSVLEQDVEDVEVVVTDDSGTLEPTVRGIADSRVRYVRNPRRLGLAGNWCAGLAAARADVVGLLMDDDRLLPGFLSRALALFDDAPDVDVVFTDHLFDHDGRLWRRSCVLPGGSYDEFLAPLVEELPVAVSAALMRRRAYEPCLPLPDLLTADVALHVRLALRGAVFAYIPEPLMVYRLHAGQQSLSEERFRHDRVAVWQLFEFADARAEAARRRRLAGALVDRAAAHLKRGRMSAAAHDLDEASAVDATIGGIRAKALRKLLGRAWAVSPSLRVFRAGKRVRGLW